MLVITLQGMCGSDRISIRSPLAFMLQTTTNTTSNAVSFLYRDKLWTSKWVVTYKSLGEKLHYMIFFKNVGLSVSMKLWNLLMKWSENTTLLWKSKARFLNKRSAVNVTSPGGSRGQNHPVWFSKTFLADVESRFGKLAGDLIVLTEWARLSTVLLTLAHFCPMPVEAQTEGGRN